MRVGNYFLYLQKSAGTDRCQTSSNAGCAVRHMNKLLHTPILLVITYSLFSLIRI